MIKQILIAATLTCTPAVLFAADDNSANTNEARTVSGQAGAHDQDMTTSFLQEAASGNELEVRLGDLAMQKSQNQQVKQIAQQIKQDHQQANQQLKQIAQQNNINVSTGHLNKVHQAILDEMKQKDGAEFDRAFVFGNAADHQKDILMYTYCSNHNQGAAKQYASQILPTLQQHYQMVQPVAQQMAGGGMATGTMQMDNMAQPAAGSVDNRSSSGNASTDIDTARTSNTGRSSGNSSMNKTNPDNQNVGTDKNGPNNSGVAGPNQYPNREIDRDNQSSPNKMGISTGENR